MQLCIRAIIFSLVLFANFLIISCYSPSRVENKKIQSGQYYLSVNENSTKVLGDDHDTIKINLNLKDLNRFKKRGSVYYSDIGAIGDGISDDIIFIRATHAVANYYGFDVKADDDALYIISGRGGSATISTNTDFGNATFIIDDTNVEDHTSSIFEVKSINSEIKIDHINSLKKGQKKINLKMDKPSLITVKDTMVRRYIRYGLNQNNGKEQTDVFLVDKNGNINENSPILWDFDNISEMNCLLIDKEKLKINGGKFLTIANQEEEKNHPYYSRNLLITRSNVEINNLRHFVKGEGKHGAPYQGFISIKDASRCSNKKLFTQWAKNVSKNWKCWESSIKRIL